jgi:hypothetical protein
MKRILLIAVFLFTIKSGYGQYYTFTQLNQPYNTISGGTVVSTAGWDYLNTFVIPFPFSFEYFGMPFDTFYVQGGSGGFINLGGGNLGDYQLYFYDAPVFDMGSGISPISYSVLGTAPNRTLVLQLENVGFIYDPNLTDYFEVQVWFHETTNVLEIHNGPSSVQSSDSWWPQYNGPTVSLDRDSVTYFELYGPANNATASSNPPVDYITGSPDVTNVYRFTPTFTGIEKIISLPLFVFPNPSNGNITVNSARLNSAATFSLFDLKGQLLRQVIIEPGIINFSFDLENGIYLLRIRSNEGEFIQRLIINR